MSFVRNVIDRLPVYKSQIRHVYRTEGFFSLVKKIFKKSIRFLKTKGDPQRMHRLSYMEWMRNIEAEYLSVKSMRKDLEGLNIKPKFSVIFPVWNKSEYMIQKALDSILNQVYDNYEICISDGSSKFVAETKNFLNRYKDRYPEKIKVAFLPDRLRNKINLIENSNNAIDMSTGEYLVFMDCDDEICPNCLLELAKSINENPKVEFIYSDFDKIDKQGNRYDPSFWPDFSPHTLTSKMYTTHVTCYRKDIFEKIGGLQEGTVGAQDWDLVMRYISFKEYKDFKNVIHIPKVLYHWRVYEGSTSLPNSGSKNWAYESQRRVLLDYLKRRDMKGKVLEGPYQGAWRIKFEIVGNPKVSIIMPMRDKVELTKRAVESILEKTNYENYEIVIVDNQSEEGESLDYLKKIQENQKVKVLIYDKPYHFGKLNNWAVDQVDGEYILMLNNDIEVVNKGWLEAMLEYCQLPEVGSVGAKLYYPNGKIQHAGVVVGLGGAAAHSHRLMDGDTFGYEGAVSSVKNYIAVTGACVMIRRDLFKKVKGFDETYDPAYQDVDLGIRLYEEGYYTVYTPYSELIHYESVTRFDEKNKFKLMSDEDCAKLLRKRWSKYIIEQNDPFYNPNLSYDHEDFRIRKIST